MKTATKTRLPKLLRTKKGGVDWNWFFQAANIGKKYSCNRSVCKTAYGRAPNYGFWVESKKDRSDDSYIISVGGIGQKMCGSKTQEIANAEARELNLEDKLKRAEIRIAETMAEIETTTDFDRKQHLKGVLALWRLDLVGVRNKIKNLGNANHIHTQTNGHQ